MKKLNLYISTSELALLAVILLPFWIFVGISESISVNGHVVSHYKLNVLAISVGLIGAYYGIVNTLRIVDNMRSPASERSIETYRFSGYRLPIMIGFIAISTLQLLTGADVI